MGNPIGDWIARRSADGVIRPTATTLGSSRSSATTGRHWLPATGPFAQLNQTLGDPAEDLWVTCEIRMDAVGPRWKARSNVYLHKRKDAVVRSDHPLLQAVAAIVGAPVSTEGWKEWRTAASVTRQDLSVDDAYAFADREVIRYGGTAPSTSALKDAVPSTAVRESATPARTVPDVVPEPALAAANSLTGPHTTIERQVFIASKIAGYPKARAVRHSIKAKLSGFGYQAYVAESDALGGFLQSNIDRMVETSDHVVAIVWDTIGEATSAEIELAMRTAGTGGRPRVHLFVSQDEEHHAARAGEPSRRTQEFLDQLDKERRYVRFFQGDRDLVDQVGDLFAGLDL